MNSFSFAPLSTALWLTLIELNLFVLSPQLSTVLLGAAPYGCELLLRAYRTDRYCCAFRFAVTLPVNRFSRYGTGKMPFLSGNSPDVLTACVLSCCVRSTAAKKWALSLAIGPPKLPPNWFWR